MGEGVVRGSLIEGGEDIVCARCDEPLDCGFVTFDDGRWYHDSRKRLLGPDCWLLSLVEEPGEDLSLFDGVALQRQVAIEALISAAFLR